MKRISPTLLACALVAVLSTPAEAQHRAEGGDWSVAVALFETGTGTEFSLGRMFTDRLHGAIELTYRRAKIEDNPETLAVGVQGESVAGSWLIGPTVRFYGAQRGPVVPYLRGKFAFGNAVSDLNLAGNQLRDQDVFSIQMSGAIGAEWFPVKGIGLSGHTGFQFSRESLERFDENNEKLERTTDNYGTFRSSLILSFYFR